MCKFIVVRRLVQTQLSHFTAAISKYQLEPSNITGSEHATASPELLHLRRECVRVRLLQILDLPFVDNVISSPTERRTACNHGGGQRDDCRMFAPDLKT